MTTNHPAHGPVSLDRLHQISEILSKAAAQSDGGNLGYAMADAVKVIDSAIADFGAGDVSQCDSRKQFEEHFGDGTTPGMERVPPFFVEMMKDAFWTVWEDSRAAMLQAENHTEQRLDMVEHSGEANKMVVGNYPVKISLRNGIEAIRNSGIPVDFDKIQSECEAGNSPATTDGWIPVSERMPLTPYENCLYEDVEVQVFAGDDVFIAHYAIGALPEPWGAWLDTAANITHWQPLAAAPQQEVKS
ncbi:DUF551 domain-containing protein [Citrobacter braakii]|uniref:DUF551 domain-containing protein n=1 Tax=Citrobacter braakii TaxID=57706 RepID=UPI0028BD1D81|nr:DUF551 domain-containing protein [Citrobacter braakii]MDT7059476.1 DUF551 domain-containing protein [Citrobacter braakii]